MMLLAGKEWPKANDKSSERGLLSLPGGQVVPVRKGRGSVMLARIVID